MAELTYSQYIRRLARYKQKKYGKAFLYPAFEEYLRENWSYIFTALQRSGQVYIFRYGSDTYRAYETFSITAQSDARYTAGMYLVLETGSVKTRHRVNDLFWLRAEYVREMGT